jgi:hypothetical protein
MKNTEKIFGIFALVAAILFMAACATSKPGGTSTPGGTSSPGGTSTPAETSAPSGTYYHSKMPTLTVTFGPGYFTFFTPASLSGTGKDEIINGTFTISGKTLLLRGLAQAETFTIVDSNTLTESNGDVWKKQ